MLDAYCVVREEKAGKFKMYAQQFPVAHWLVEVQSEPAAQLEPEAHV